MSPTRSIVLSLAALAALSACGPQEGSGVIASEDFQVRDFSKVKVSDGISAEIQIGARRVSVTTDDNLLEDFRFDVDGETLKITRQGGETSPTFSRVIITTPRLEGLEVTDRSQVNAQATQFENWRLVVTDRSNANVVGITATRLEIESRDESRVDASGLVRDIDIDAHQNSVVNADGVSAGEAKLDVSGGSLVNVNVTRSIEIDASGSSRIIVSGNPPERNVDADGSSEVVFGTQ